MSIGSHSRSVDRRCRSVRDDRLFRSTWINPIRIVVPVSYRGLIRLIVDSDNGSNPSFEKGHYVYRVQDGGVLLIKNAGPFHRWHTLQAEFADRRPIPMDDRDVAFATETVVWHSFGSASRTAMHRPHHISVGDAAQETIRAWSDAGSMAAPPGRSVIGLPMRRRG